MKHEFQYFTDVIKYQADHFPDQVAYTFQRERISYQALWESTCQYASQLSQQGIQPGQPTLVALPNGHAFFSAFFACQLIGAIPVPIAPTSGIQRIEKLGKLAQANHLIYSKENQFATGEMATSLNTHAIEEIDRKRGKIKLNPDFTPHEIAFIQFTSGTTGDPKGAIITHINLLTNIQQMIAGMEITKEDIFVSWLPIYHDMGLILMALTPIVLGVPTYLLPTSLQALSVWLEAIQTNEATFTAAPDFAYRMLFRYIRNPNKIDLSSLRVALNAAEPVRAHTLERFHQFFGLENVMVAGYGLAETTVGVSMWQPGTANRIDPAGFVSVGQSFPEIDIKIIQDETEVESGQQGEIVIKSPANISGYFLQDCDSDSLFWKNDYVRSGDIGYLDEDNYLYILDRKKNIIKHIGRTIAPKEIEEVVEAFSQIRQTAVLGIDRKGVEGEQIVIFAELRRAKKQDVSVYQNLVIDLVNAVYAHIGIRPAEIVFLKPRTIPKTHNGKTQYAVLKNQFLSDRLENQGLILFSN